MADGTTPLPSTPNDAPTPRAAAEGCAQPLVERQVEALGELAEIGLRLARAIDRQVSDEAAGPPSLADLNAAAMAYARVARAVRQTLLLQSKITEALRAGEASTAARAARRASVKARIAGLVRGVVEAEHNDAEQVERLVAEAAERLEQEAWGDEGLERPIQAIMADICEALGLHPDWTGLSRKVADVQAFAQRVGDDAGDDEESGPIEVYWIGDDGRPVPRPARRRNSS
ncbi:MAG: hypothetical protein ACXU8Q_07540 [Caulobacteraceae bacterium]